MKRLAMCESILLTVREIAREQDNAVVAFHQPGGPDGDLELGDYVNRYICRAQVRKVAEWLETNSIDTWEPATQTYTTRSQSMLVWKALKAAGEGK